MQGEVVVVRVGWMTWYGSRPGKDALRGGGSFNDDDRGSEVERLQGQKRNLLWLRAGLQCARA